MASLIDPQNDGCKLIRSFDNQAVVIISASLLEMRTGSLKSYGAAAEHGLYDSTCRLILTKQCTQYV
jgi:hypothetical protein